MTTPAVYRDLRTSAAFTAKWFYGGVHYPNGDLRVTLSTSRDYRQRPESVPGGKVDGLWPLKSWHNAWVWGNSTHKSFVSYNKASPYDRYVFTSAPFMGVDVLVGAAVQLAPFLDGGLFPVNLESTTRRDFLTELAGTKWELGTSLAEAKETAGFLRQLASETHRLARSMAQRIGTSAQKMSNILSDADFNVAFNQGLTSTEIDRGYNSVRNRKRRAAARQRLERKYGRQTVASLASAWLGAQFGLKPMLHDLADATVHLNNLVTAEKEGVKMRCSVTRGGQETVRHRMNYDSSVLTGSGEVTWVVDSACTIVGDYVLDDRMLRSNRQLALTSQLSMGYEIIPYSWLLDYVVDVGGWIKSLDAPLGLRCTGAAISRTQKLKPVLIKPENKYMGYDGIKAYKPEAFEIGRTTRSLVPMVYPGLPPLGDMLSVTQAVNAVSVLTQLVFGRR